MTITDAPREAGPGSDPTAPPRTNPPEVRAKVPFAMTSSNFVPRERYFSREFHEAEKEYLWPYAWQMAARLEEVPNPGDYTEYEVAGYSILIIRQKDGSVKALHNACRHRATELAKGCGRLPGGQIVCPFHGWRWNLDGSSSSVFMRDAFDAECLEPSELALQECKVEVWAGMVWINMDLNARPLSEALFPVQQDLEAVGVGNMRVKWWKKVILKANWKMAQEAFFEAYHVMQTHPQLLQGGGEKQGVHMSESVEYSQFVNGHARFQAGTKQGGGAFRDKNAPEHFIEANRLLAQGQDAMALDRDVQIFEGLLKKYQGDNFSQAAIAALFDYAAGAGIPMAPPGEHTRLWGGDIFLFPNFLMLPMYENCLCYRSRPYDDNPEKCEFELWSLTTYPEGHEPERAELLGTFDKDDDEHWGLIPRQDINNIERQQRGLHSRSYKHHRLSSAYEWSISNMHQELDRVIAANC